MTLPRGLGGKAVAESNFEHLFSGARHDSMPAPGGRLGALANDRAGRRLVTVITALGAAIASVIIITVLGLMATDHAQQQQRHFQLLLRLAGGGLESSARISDTVRAPLADDLQRLLPPHAFGDGRTFIIINADGVVQAIAGDVPGRLNLEEGEMLPDALRRVALAADGRAEISTLYLPEAGEELLVGAVPLSTWPGVVLLLQPANGKALWQNQSRVMLGSILGLLVMLIALLLLYNWQADQQEAHNASQHAFISQLEEAMELGRCGLWDWDVTRGRIHLTPSMCQLLGLQGVNGYMDLADFLHLQHPEEPPIDELLEEKLRSGARTFEQELRLRNQASGTWLWVKLRGALPDNDDGQPHLLGIAVDITAQKRATAEKRNAEQQLEQAIESISESFALWDASMRLVKCNSKFREFHGLPADACRPGRAYAEVMGDARCRCRRREFRHMLEGQNGRETVMEMQLEDGRWLQISERQMAGGGCVSVGTEITELKQKQLELEKSRHELVETVRALEQTQAEIEHKNARLRAMARRLQVEKERAERALRLKSQILANVSHELLTPLNHILFPADMMRNQSLGALSTQYRDYAQKILDAGEQMKRKIIDIMEYAALSTESLEPSLASVDVMELLTDVMEPLVCRAEQKGLALHWRVPEKMQMVADAKRLGQALRHLVDNAITFTDEGEVEASAWQEDDGSIVFEVRDTGTGIDKEQLARISEPFERVGNAYNSHQGGAGVGLAIVRAVVEMHGGSMDISSEPGRGTRVRLSIPPLSMQAREPVHLQAEGTAATSSSEAPPVDQPAASASGNSSGSDENEPPSALRQPAE